MNNSSKNEKRVEWIDVLKGIVIIFVVFGHNIQYGSGEIFFHEKSYFGNLIFRLIYSFHMPCFMLISGYFFGFTVEKPKFIKNRFNTLLAPIIVWSMIPVAFRIASKTNEGALSLKMVLSTLIRTQITYYWFLWAILICSFIVWTMYKISLDRTFLFLIIGGVLLFTPDWLNTEFWKFMYPYFVTGYLWNKREKKFYLDKRQTCFLMIFLIVAYIFLFNFYDERSFIYTSGIRVTNFNQLLIDIHRWLIGYVGSIIMILIVKNTYDHVSNYALIINRGMAYIGKASLVIYIIDCLLNDYLIQRVTKNFILNYRSTIIETILVLIFALSIYHICQSTSLVRRFLLGSR